MGAFYIFSGKYHVFEFVLFLSKDEVVVGSFLMLGIFGKSV